MDKQHKNTALKSGQYTYENVYNLISKKGIEN